MYVSICILYMAHNHSPPRHRPYLSLILLEVGLHQIRLIFRNDERALRLGASGALVLGPQGAQVYDPAQADQRDQATEHDQRHLVTLQRLRRKNFDCKKKLKEK